MISMRLTYHGATGESTAGGFYIGASPGPKIVKPDKVAWDAADIMKLSPSKMGPPSKTASINVTALDTHRWYRVGDDDADGIVATVYIWATKGSGLISVAYEMQLDSPKPF